MTAPTSLPFSIDHDPPWLIARFVTPQRMLSWAVHRSGYQVADRVAWRQVRNADLPVSVDPVAYLRQRLAGRKLEGAVGLMTSSDLAHHHIASATRETATATCLITLGLSNAERVGRRRPLAEDRRSLPPGYGTINALCHLSVALSDAALLEASSIATQARTTAILDHGYMPETGLGAITGTGTDCIVMACPSQAREGQRFAFAGLHTAVGEALGAAVLAATAAAMTDWLQCNVSAEATSQRFHD